MNLTKDQIEKKVVAVFGTKSNYAKKVKIKSQYVNRKINTAIKNYRWLSDFLSDLGYKIKIVKK